MIREPFARLRSRAGVLGLVLAGVALASWAAAQESRNTSDAVSNASSSTQGGQQKYTAPPARMYEDDDRWWSPGERATLPNHAYFKNSAGLLGIIHTGGDLDTTNHPFFTPLGTNGRACVTCHQPADSMGLSLQTIRQRWEATAGKDPLFAAFDGSNCPSLPQGVESSHSLLLNHGLFRIGLPWPPKRQDGTRIDPEFTIEVVRDPTGCNTDPTYGMHSANPTVSVYRRPRAVANMRYISASYKMRAPRGRRFNNKTGEVLAINPDTGERVGLPILSDARQPTLKAQAIEAAMTHLQATKPPTPEQLNLIESFENQLHVAQSFHNRAGQLDAPGGPTALGPLALVNGRPHVSGNRWATPVFGNFDAWETRQPDETDEQREFRESVMRGYGLFLERPIWIRDTAHFNSIGMGNPYKRNCTICHSLQLMGTDTTPGVLDIGVNNKPWAPDMPDLPLFKITCKKDSLPHAYLGHEVLTHDPGRALITGRCADVGALVMQPLRGLVGRPPYFSNGSAKDLAAVIDFYDKRYDMKLTEQEKTDFVNFLSVL
jgi:hypothetical protein